MRFWAIWGLLAIPATAATVSFEQDVQPILDARCVACHQGSGAQKGLRLSSGAGVLAGGDGGPAVIAGNPEASLLVARIGGEKPSMPPMGQPLTADEVELIRRWVSEGATVAILAEPVQEQGGWWSLQPFRPVEPPASNTDALGEIDRFVVARLREKGLEPSPRADRRTLIRRLKYDLLGLPPTPEEIDAFVADTTPGAYEDLVDRYLDDTAYGERWGRHWLDIARFGESNGYEQNHLRNNAWPYRDWVIRAFNEDKPYNRMILEQIAGDQIAPGDPSVEAATGFLVAGPHDTVRIQNPEGEAQKRANHLDDMITGTASAFLGLTVHCARCHDHKFDPIPQKDYYRLQASLAGVWHGERDWAEADEIAEYKRAEKTLKAEVDDAKAILDELRGVAKPRVETQRESILASYRPSVDPQGTEETFEPVEAKFVRLNILAPSGGRRIVDLDEFEVWTAGADARNVALEGTATAGSTRVEEARPDTYTAANINDGKFSERWISAGGMPEYVAIELPRTTRIDRVSWSSDRLKGFSGRFSRSMPEKYEVAVSLDGKVWNVVASSAGRLPYAPGAQERLLLFAVFDAAEKSRWEASEARKSTAERQLKQLDKPASAFLGRFEQPKEPNFVMVRGNPLERGDEVRPRSLSVLDDLLANYELDPNANQGERRLALARWIASDTNALTARVIANRVWMHHFGRPLVRTPSDFGVNGGLPTHPDLLEWLAQRLVSKHGWRLKPLHRDIVLSAAYRQASTFRETAADVDSDAQFLWRFPPRRLSAEEVRDSILAVSGALDRTMGGPGFQLYRYTVDNVATYYPITDFGPETYRRSVYHQHARSVKAEMLGQFDCPDSALAAPKRVSTTTPLQALSLLNNPFMLDQARLLAERSERDAGPSPDARLHRLWRLAFGRAPEPAEAERAAAFADENGWPLLTRALFNANEFVYVF